MDETLLKKLAKPMLVCAPLIWGSTFFMIKDALDDVDALFMLAFRFTLAAVLLAAVFWRRWRDMDLVYLWQGGLLGLLMGAAYILQTFGLMGTTPGKNAFFTAVYCVIVPFLYWAVDRKRPTRWNVLAALLSVTGIGLVSWDGGGLTIAAGDVLTLCAGFLLACHIVAVAKVSPDRDIYLLTVFQFAFAALYAWVGGALTETFPAGALARAEVLLPMAYLAVMATTVALLFQNVGQVWSDPASASVILSLESVFGVLCSVAFAGDRVSVRMLAGFVLIFVAVVCSETKFGFLRKKQGRIS